MQGLILKGIGGFYYIKNCDESDKEIYCCKARGKFRKEKISPLVGDIVEFTAGEGEGESESEGSIDKIHPRKNKLTRPAIANIDKLFIITSVQDPSPNIYIIDKTIAIARLKDIEPILVVTKKDLKKSDDIEEKYKKVGIKVFAVSHFDLKEKALIENEFKNSISAFTGNSGVGKSTLINAMFPNLSLETGDISKKLGRGRHTTRHVELFEISKNSFIADTPGFSTVELQKYELVEKDELAYGFVEFEDYLGKCKFNSCTHTCEKHCAILEALQNGEIEKTRHESYVAMYNELKGIKSW
ncbi:MAG: ribosome small subunit-dependent GTPase A [Clostridia bacterium]